MIETTPSRLGCLNFYHPEMQQQLLDLAVAAGAELRRPAEVTGVIPGDPPVITLRANGVEQRVLLVSWSGPTGEFLAYELGPACRWRAIPIT